MKTTVVAVTDRLGECLSNGSQVFANALVLQLAQWFDVLIVTAQAEAPHECLAGRLLVVPQGATGELPNVIVHRLRHVPKSVLYNLGATAFSCGVVERLHAHVPEVALVNHFQVLLDVCAECEGWETESADALAPPQRTLAAVAARNLFPSFSEMSSANSQWGCSAVPSYVVPNAFVGADIGQHVPITDSPFTFMAAGRFGDYAKGADLLYRAFAAVHRIHPTVRLEIASADRRFTELLNPLPSSSWNLLGWLDRKEMLRRMRIADAVVVPSRYEPFGMVAIEAMAVGTPVIAMAVGGLAEIVCHGATGWLCPPKEGSRGLRLAMEEALRDRPRTLAMGKLAQQCVEREYSLTRVATAVRTHLENAASRGGELTVDSASDQGAP